MNDLKEIIKSHIASSIETKQKTADLVTDEIIRSAQMCIDALINDKKNSSVRKWWFRS